jgi:hypothetical protein
VCVCVCVCMCIYVCVCVCVCVYVCVRSGLQATEKKRRGRAILAEVGSPLALHVCVCVYV